MAANFGVDVVCVFCFVLILVQETTMNRSEKTYSKGVLGALLQAENAAESMEKEKDVKNRAKIIETIRNSIEIAQDLAEEDEIDISSDVKEILDLLSDGDEKSILQLSVP